jgi:hypothetical protein
MRKVRFLHWSYFIWTVLPLAILAFVQAAGIPSFLWSYSWSARGPNSYSDSSQRYYTRCTYFGLNGTVTEYPLNGECGWLRFPARTEWRP